MPPSCASVFRTSLKANYTVSNLGFRCAKDITKTIKMNKIFLILASLLISCVICKEDKKDVTALPSDSIFNLQTELAKSG
jgi:hypothetical protein